MPGNIFSALLDTILAITKVSITNAPDESTLMLPKY